MQKLIFTIIILLNVSNINSQETKIDHIKIEEDLDQPITDISLYYPYLHEKDVDLNCIKKNYQKHIPNI